MQGGVDVAAGRDQQRLAAVGGDDGLRPPGGPLPAQVADGHPDFVQGAEGRHGDDARSARHVDDEALLQPTNEACVVRHRSRYPSPVQFTRRSQCGPRRWWGAIGR